MKNTSMQFFHQCPHILWYNSGIFLGKMGGTSAPTSNPSEEGSGIELIDNAGADQQTLAQANEVADAESALQKQIANINRTDVKPPTTFSTFEEGEDDWDKFLEQLLDGNLEEALQTFIGMVFGDEGNRITGVGLYAQGVDQMSKESLADFLHRFQEKTAPTTDWEQKLAHAVLTDATRFELFRRGYDANNAAPLSAHNGEVIAIQQGDTLQNHVNKNIWNQLQNKDIIGPLFTSQELPVGSFLHLSEEGYPLGLTVTKDEEPPPRLLVKKLPENAMKTPEAYAESRLQPGDILFLKRKNNKESIFSGFLIAAADSVGSENFFGMHMGVYLGGGQVAHITSPKDKGEKAGKIESLAHIMSQYNLAAGRPENASAIAEAARENANNAQSYDFAKLGLHTASVVAGATTGFDIPTEQNTTQPAGNKAICWDILAGTNMHGTLPQDLFATLPVVLALNTEEVASVAKSID